MIGCGLVDWLDPVAVLHSVLISSVVHKDIIWFKDNVSKWPFLNGFNEAVCLNKILSQNGKTAKKLMVC